MNIITIFVTLECSFVGFILILNNAIDTVQSTMLSNKGQLSQAMKTTLVVGFFSAVFLSYRIINYVWSTHLGSVTSPVLGASIVLSGLPMPLIIENEPIPSPTPLPEPNDTPASAPSTYTADASVSWKAYAGITYPYIFSAPSTLPLVRYPDTNFDAYAVSWNDVPIQSTILINMNNLASDPKQSGYINQDKSGYVYNWWRQFSGYAGVSSVTQFINGTGLKGYRAKYITTEGTTPNDDVFFEIPARPDLMIRIANGTIIDPTIFNKIVDTVGWQPPTTTPTPIPTTTITASTPSPVPSASATPIPTATLTPTSSPTPSPTATATPTQPTPTATAGTAPTPTGVSGPT